MYKYQAVIFDLDGTLADSLEDIADAMNRTLTKFGFPVHEYKDYKYFVGKGLKNLTISCLPENERNDETVEKCFRFLMEDYRQNYLVKTKLYDGISDLLDDLDKKGLKLAVLSNKTDEITQSICNVILKYWHFEVILGFSDTFPRKPKPDAALFIAKQLNVSPEKMLYLGDTGIDMRTACAAGMFPVGVTWGFRKREELEEYGAKLIINHPMELANATVD